MSLRHSLLLILSASVIFIELCLVVYYSQTVFEWVSHNLWVVVLPFVKVIAKRLITLKLFSLLKGIGLLAWHFSKQLILKLVKTLSVRYGVFFSQSRWRWIRRAKVLFLRRGKQFFRSLLRFWRGYKPSQKWVILVAFFPVVLMLFVLGLSFNVTRKTMVQKAQESAMFEVANTAHKSSKSFRYKVSQLDSWVLKKLQELAPRAKP